jgi:hypothetical protein
MDLDTLIAALLGVGAGGLLTFTAQMLIQKRVWKKERAEEIYAPLLDQLGDVEGNLNTLTELNPSYPEWKGLRERHLLHWIKPELKDKLWKFFDVDSSRFNIGLINVINDIKDIAKEEISQNIKEERRDEVKKTTPFCSTLFWYELAKLVFKKEESGFLGDTSYYPRIKTEYGELEKDFKVKMPFDDFIKNLASKIKGKPSVDEVKKEWKERISKTKELMREVEKELRI